MMKPQQRQQVLLSSKWHERERSSARAPEYHGERVESRPGYVPRGCWPNSFVTTATQHHYVIVAGFF